MPSGGTASRNTSTRSRHPPSVVPTPRQSSSNQPEISNLGSVFFIRLRALVGHLSNLSKHLPKSEKITCSLQFLFWVKDFRSGGDKPPVRPLLHKWPRKIHTMGERTGYGRKKRLREKEKAMRERQGYGRKRLARRKKTDKKEKSWMRNKKREEKSYVW